MFSKLSAFLCSLLILVQAGGIGYDDILRLDELIEHAAFHKQQYGDDLFAFLDKHYGPDKEDHHMKHQEEQDDHQELPFQNQQCQHQASQAFLLQLIGLRKDFQLFTFDVECQRGFHYMESDYDSHCFNIFQPPRLV